ncbi:MAG TPA: stage V sporulation protein AE [Ruminococcaceae bacterium]|nr:stage V sporulation protein AE [Oscillospiraceae bacterium]
MSVLFHCISAFIVGGFICLIGQALIDYTNLTPARILSGFVVFGVALTAVGLYQPLVDFCGAGATVPLSGFGYALAKGVESQIAENGAIGIITGGLTATAAGITVALVLGFVCSVLFKPDEK